MDQQAPPTSIVPLMIGTAGHVDHGKTSLVKNLTGHETDRHPEEKQRGVSIDFGVAPFELSDGRVVGIIDVPGHEDFIRNMVAGASSIDLLMLVVAADDSVMPQTIEHLRIVKLLGMSRLIVVITKSDLVQPELLEVVREELAEFVAKAGFPGAPLIAVSNVTGDGIAEVKAELEHSLDLPPRTDHERSFRMDVRTVFSMKGHGTVITGVPRAGRIAAGDELEILPVGTKTRVRGVQNYRRQTDSTSAHISSAVNLRDVDTAAVHRGMSLVQPGTYSVVDTAIADFLNDSSETITKRKVFRFSSGTSTVSASCRIIGGEQLAPGDPGFVHLRFSGGIVLAAGDRFILRTPSGSGTIGGGTILAVNTGRMRRPTEESLERLASASEAAQSGDVFLSQILVGSHAVYRAAELLRLTQSPATEAARLLKEMKRSGVLHELGADCFLVASRLRDVASALTKAAARYHLLHRYTWGMKPTYVAELLKIEPGAFDTLFGLLRPESELVLKHNRLALSSFQPQIGEHEMKQRELVLDSVTKAGIVSVARGPLLEQCSLTEKDLRHVSRLLIDEDLIVLLDNNFLLRSLYENSREALLELFADQPVVDINAFRAKTGTSRNVAALILDSFDAEGMTKRSEAGRVLVQKRVPKS